MHRRIVSYSKYLQIPDSCNHRLAVYLRSNQVPLSSFLRRL